MACCLNLPVLSFLHLYVLTDIFTSKQVSSFTLYNKIWLYISPEISSTFKSVSCYAALFVQQREKVKLVYS